MTWAEWRSRRVIRGSVAALLASAATAAYAQEQGDPPPPQPPTTTIVEPIAEPDTPPETTEPQQPQPQGPEHVPPSAGSLDLSTLETKNFSLLYFDPVQTYLTPYIGRSIEEFSRYLDSHNGLFHLRRSRRIDVGPLHQNRLSMVITLFLQPGASPENVQTIGFHDV